MKMLKIFLKHPQLFNCTGYEADAVTGKEYRITEKTKREILDLVTRARIIAIEGSLLESTIKGQVPKVDSTLTSDQVPEALRKASEAYPFKQRQTASKILLEKSLAPPFQLTWFEIYSSNNSGSVPMHFYEVVVGSGKAHPIASVGMLVNEIGPGVYDIFSLEASPSETSGMVGNIGWNITVMRNVGAEFTPRSDMVCQLSLRHWLKAIELGAMGMENTDEAILLPRGNGNKGKVKPHKINQIIRVVPKNKRESIKPITDRGVIDWSHRWEVRGHWRKKAGIGKNREGQYVEEGWTWVHEFVKGPEDKPIVKKTRVFVGESA